MRVSSRFPWTMLRLGVMLAAALLLTLACSERGPHSLSDVNYWRVKLSRGEGIDEVVAQGSAAVPLLKQKLGWRDIAAGLVCYSGVVVISTGGNPASFRSASRSLAKDS